MGKTESYKTYSADLASRSEAAQNNDEKPSDFSALHERYLRALADMENLRKKRNTHVEKAVRDERRAMLLAFLDVVDSLQHALEAHDDMNSDWAQGTRAICKQMLDVFKQYDVKPFRCLDKAFDPKRHEAVGSTNDSGKPDGTIVQVVQTGYHCRDGSILRPAKVIVAQKGN